MDYSPARRTALVLSGTGAHGAYHAGVLRAFHEAGVKIDVVGGHGIGAAAAALTAIDGASALWDQKSVWRSESAERLYAWRAAWRLIGSLGVVLVVLLLLQVGFLSVDFPLPSGIPYAALAVAALIAIIYVAAGLGQRTARCAWRWSLLSAPIDVTMARSVFADAIWRLVRGGAAIRPGEREMGRRYGEVLAESLGQPGVRELVLVATDLDARQDLVAALLRESFRGAFMAPRPGRERQSEAIDLAGAGRDHALDVVYGALTPPIAAEPHRIPFAPESFWRGERHRLCDRPGCLSRLLEELHAAGVEQAIVVTALRPRSTPHKLAGPVAHPLRRLGEAVAAMETSALRDALQDKRPLFHAFFVISPSHNPIGPYDVGGAYDQASDRQHSLAELMERGYEDAHSQFIEPVVGASGDNLQREI